MGMYTDAEWAKGSVQEAYAARSAEWMERRATMTWTDQHGRHWDAMTQFKNKPFPCWTGTPRPAGWSAPHPELMPPSEYLSPLRGQRIRVDYARWRESLRDAWKERTAHAKIAAKDMYGERAGDAWDERSPAVMEAVGTFPLHPLFVDALEAGDLWALGIPKGDGSRRDVPDWAKPYVAQLPSVRKAEAAAEMASAKFVTQDDAPMGRAVAFTPNPDQYDEVADLTAAPKRTRGRPKKVAPVDDDLNPTDDE